MFNWFSNNALNLCCSLITGGIFAKIVGMALDKKPDIDIVETKNISQSSNNVDDETDTDFHETLPRDVLKIKDIVFKHAENKKKGNVEFKADGSRPKLTDIMGLKVKLEKEDDRSEKKANIEKQKQEKGKEKPEKTAEEVNRGNKKMDKKQPSETSTQSKQSDSTIGSVIPVIMISTTESDEETLQSQKSKGETDEETKETTERKNEPSASTEGLKRMKKSISDMKSLKRQSSVDSFNNEQKYPKEKKADEGHKYQYSL